VTGLLQRRDVTLDGPGADLEAFRQHRARPAPPTGPPQLLGDGVEPIGPVHLRDSDTPVSPGAAEDRSMTTDVLFHHSVPGSGFDPRPRSTAACGATLHAPSRPGYGEAPPLEGEVPTLHAVADLTAAQLRAAGVEHLDLVIGWSGGGHHALALAAAHPDLVTAVALVGAPAPDEAVAWIPDEFRPAIATLRDSPTIAVEMLRQALDGTEPVVDLVCGGDADIALLGDDRELARRLDATLVAAFAQGGLGMATDLVAQHVSPWHFDAGDVTQPVTLLYGADDPIIDIAHGHHWADALPHAQLEVRADAGHLLIASAWEELLRTCP
jgi:pimeloyl-ACP methyl ester carboxylesterase